MKTTETIVKIGGMTCAMCVKAIENGLRDLAGIVTAEVNLGVETARITYDPARVALPDIQRVIEENGYQFLGVAGEAAEDQEHAAREQDLRLKFPRAVVGSISGVEENVSVRALAITPPTGCAGDPDPDGTPEDVAIVPGPTLP